MATAASKGVGAFRSAIRYATTAAAATPPPIQTHGPPGRCMANSRSTSATPHTAAAEDDAA